MLEVAIQKELGQFQLDVRLAVQDEVVAIFGPSGSGKSLTLQCIAGLLRPDSGRIAINGRPVFDSVHGINLRPQDRRVGYVFQDFALLPHMSVADNIAYGLHRLPKGERRARVQKMVASMRLEGLEDRYPAKLSGGQQQRVAFARALATEPEILLLDEPFSALDGPIRSRLHGELLAVLKGLRITAVLVTHNLAEAYSLSETMAVYDSGHVLQIGPRDDILRRPADRRVARFTATKNLFRGEVVGSTDSFLAVRAGALLVHTPPATYRVGDVIDFCIRPEEIMLVRPDRVSGSAVEENQYPGLIVGEVAYGTTFTLHLRLAGDPLGQGRDYDLQVDTPAHVYYRLEVESKKDWTVSLKKEAIWVIGIAASAAEGAE